jgi:hydroxymethylpyrimidine/phosphomethylpyrimidine kinase
VVSERPPVAISIAGTDSGGGAGITADLKTFEAHGVWGTCAVVAVTAQNTLGVQAFETLPASLVQQQIRSVADDIGIDAGKTGMLASAELVSAVADVWR